MKKVIVSGANGFVGTALIKELVAHDYEVYALARKNHHDNIPYSQCVHLVEFDLAEAGKLLDLIPVDSYEAFYHLAWKGVSGSDRANPDVQIMNLQSTLDCLKVAKDLGCKRFIPTGSIMEYESIEETYTQGCQPGLGYIYGAGKVAAHIMCMSLAAHAGIDLIWPMITNTYGPGEKSPRLVNSTIRKCLAGISPQFTAGKQRYDFVYIDDVARAFRMIAEHGKPFHHYLIGSGHAKPLKEFLLEMKAAIAPNLDFLFGEVPFTGVDVPLRYFDCSDTEKDTGFKAAISFGEGCKRTMNWWKMQKDCL